MAKSLYEVIEEIKEDREGKDDYFTSQASQASQDALSLCNDSNNSVTQFVTSTSQERHKDPAPIPSPESGPVAKPAEPLEDRLMTYYTAKLEAIAVQYIDGCMEWLQQRNPDLYSQIWLSYGQIDDVWKLVLTGGTTVADFEATVDTWNDLQIEATRLFKENTELERAVAKAYKREQREQSIPACPACHSRNWWIDRYGERKCSICHPDPRINKQEIGG